MNKIYWAIMSGFLLSACNSRKFENFDDKSWKNDRNGCTGKRLLLVQDILSRKSEIYGFTEVDVLKNFGKPDINDLRRRQQKFYYYYVQNPDKCNDSTKVSKALKLRFNAVDKVQEILYE